MFYRCRRLGVQRAQSQTGSLIYRKLLRCASCNMNMWSNLYLISYYWLVLMDPLKEHWTYQDGTYRKIDVRLIGGTSTLKESVVLDEQGAIKGTTLCEKKRCDDKSYSGCVVWRTDVQNDSLKMLWLASIWGRSCPKWCYDIMLDGWHWRFWLIV